MWYRMTVNEFDYTRTSWLFIVPAWAALPASAWIAMRARLTGALLLMAASLAASWYFSDVFGFAAGAFGFAVGLETALRAVFGRRVEGAA
jgi:hypothetical protein